MITYLDQLDLKATNSYADYRKRQFEERYELISEKIFKMSPALAHRYQKRFLHMV